MAATTRTATEPLGRLDHIKSLDDVTKLLQASTDEIFAAFKLTGYEPHPAIPFKVAV